MKRASLLAGEREGDGSGDVDVDGTRRSRSRRDVAPDDSTLARDQRPRLGKPRRKPHLGA